ncbi:MAG: hypothetical protein KDK03_18250 [Rhodobacteraceae bacterium]|nr:hypothetical protein [Paracoccaceae bacterium]
MVDALDIRGLGRILRMANRRPKRQANSITAYLIKFSRLAQITPAVAGVPKYKQEQKHGEQDGAIARIRPGYRII